MRVEDLRSGASIHVLFNGRYYKASVLKVAKTRVKVKYASDGSVEHILNEYLPLRIKSISTPIPSEQNGDSSGGPSTGGTIGGGIAAQNAIVIDGASSENNASNGKTALKRAKGKQ